MGLRATAVSASPETTRMIGAPDELTETPRVNLLDRRHVLREQVVVRHDDRRRVVGDQRERAVLELRRQISFSV
jgi:hypothetical protein